jgi:hypothetical protein
VLDGENAGISLGTSDTFAIKNTSGVTRRLKISASYDASMAGATKVLGLALAVNGVVDLDTECRATTGIQGAIAKLATQWIIDLADGDEVALFVANHSSTVDIDFQRGRIVATSVAGFGPQGPTGATGPAGPTGVVTATAPITYDSGTQTVGIESDAFAPLLLTETTTRTANYTLALTDQGRVVPMDGTSLEVTVPTNAAVAFPIGSVVNVYNLNASDVTIQGDTGVTVRNDGDLAQYGEVSLRKRGTDEWVVAGNLS